MTDQDKPLFAVLSMSWQDDDGGLHGQGESRIIACRQNSYLAVLRAPYKGGRT